MFTIAQEHSQSEIANTEEHAAAELRAPTTAPPFVNPMGGGGAKVGTGRRRIQSPSGSARSDDGEAGDGPPSVASASVVDGVQSMGLDVSQSIAARDRAWRTSCAFLLCARRTGLPRMLRLPRQNDRPSCVNATNALPTLDPRCAHWDRRKGGEAIRIFHRARVCVCVTGRGGRGGTHRCAVFQVFTWRQARGKRSSTW